MRTPDDYRYEREGFTLLNQIGIELEKQREAEAKHKNDIKPLIAQETCKTVPLNSGCMQSSNKPFQLNLDLDI